MSTTTPPAAPSSTLTDGSVTAWIFRRTLLGLVILTLVVGGSAWLLHASIEPSAAEAQQDLSAGQKG